MTATRTRKRRRKPPEREIIETGSERSREIIAGFVRQQTRIRQANARTGGLPKPGRYERKHFV